MSSRDRRQTERFELEIPFSIRSLEFPEAPARMAVSSNISAMGLCLWTNLPLKVGMAIEISIRMPKQISGQPTHEWCCKGRVVRIEPRGLLHQRPCVGVEFHYYEVLKGEGAHFQN